MAVVIRSVYAANFDEESKFIINLIKDYPILSFDTEFPGIIYCPRDTNHYRKQFDNQTSDERFQFLKYNVDDLPIIQLGLTICKPTGELPLYANNPIVWEFNFREFDATVHPYNPESIDLLRRNGIDLDRNKREGISALEFSFFWVKIINSYETNADLAVVVFSGLYDFGYLVKILEHEDFPDTFSEFRRSVLINCNFARIYDVKYMCEHFNKELHHMDGLQVAASRYGLQPAGADHTAASDSHLTLLLFLTLRERYGADGLCLCDGAIYGLDHFYSTP